MSEIPNRWANRAKDFVLGAILTLIFAAIAANGSVTEGRVLAVAAEKSVTTLAAVVADNRTSLQAQIGREREGSLQRDQLLRTQFVESVAKIEVTLGKIDDRQAKIQSQLDHIAGIISRQAGIPFPGTKNALLPLPSGEN